MVCDVIYPLFVDIRLVILISLKSSVGYTFGMVHYDYFCEFLFTHIDYSLVVLILSHVFMSLFLSSNSTFVFYKSINLLVY